MNSSEYNPIRVDTTGSLFGIEPARPGQDRKKGQARRKVKDKQDQPLDHLDTDDQKDSHSLDFMA